MKKFLVILSAFLIGLSILAAGVDAQAQMVCGQRETVAENLEKVHGEVPVSMGLTSRGTLIEVFASTEKGNFTIVNTRPDGISCLIAAGEEWQQIKLTPALSAY